MPNFKKIVGNYIEVTDRLGLPSSFYAPQSLEAYNAQVKKDEERTSYLSSKKTVSQMKTDLSDTSHLTTDEARSFTQGNYDGGIFNRFTIDLSTKFSEVLALASDEGTEHDDRANTLRVAYTDDDGNYCGLSIGYLRDDPDPTKGDAFIPVEQRKRLFSVCIIKNTNLAPTERQVTLLTHSVFLKEDVAKKIPDIEEAEIPGEVDRALNSKNISRLLEGMFDGEAISTKKFAELNKRLRENRNIDDRDHKQEQLKEINDLVQNILPNDPDIQKYIQEINNRALSDINFFKDDDYQKTLEEVFINIDSSIGKIEVDEQKESLLLKSQLTYFAIKLDRKASEIESGNDEGLMLIREFKKQANLMRDLRDNPTGKEKDYRGMDDSQMFRLVEDRIPKLLKLQDFIKASTRKCKGDEEAVEHLREMENEIIKDIDSFDDTAFDIKLKTISTDFDKYLLQLEIKDTPILKEKMKDFARQLEEYAATLTEEDSEYLRKGILAKAETLKDLSYVKLVAYKNLNFEQALSDIIREINEDKLKEELTEQLEYFAAELTDKDPPGLKQRIIDEANSLREMSTQEALRYYGGKDYKTIVTELAKNSIDSEFMRQAGIIRAQSKSQKEALSAPVPPKEQEQNFFQRNRTSLIVGGVALLALISFVLILTGVLAPLGIALAAGTAIAGSAVAGGVVVTTGAVVVTDEIQLSNEIQNNAQNYESQKQKYNQQLIQIDKQCKENISQAGISLDEDLSNFLKEKFEDKSEITPNTKDHEVEQQMGSELTGGLETDQLVTIDSEPIPLLSEAERVLEQAEEQIKISVDAANKSDNVVVREPPIMGSDTSGNTPVVASEEEAADKVAQPTFK